MCEKSLIEKSVIEKSLVAIGNNHRIKRVIERAKEGHKVTLAYIGGSITEGAGANSEEKCYAYQSYKHFKKAFGKDDGSNVEFVNAGMGGTSSAIGIVRHERDITSYGQVQPDLVFVEFAVNDHEEPTKGVAYESLIRKILKQANKPAVVLIFSVFPTKYNLQDQYIPTGNYYNLPMISIKDAIVPELETGTITDEDFFFDEYHPTDLGHAFMADCIMHYFATVDKQSMVENDIEIGELPIVGNSFEDIKMVDNKTDDDNVKIDKGSFTEVDAKVTSRFPDNWMNVSVKESKAFRVTLNCKNILLLTKSTSDSSYGKAQVYLDGKLIKTIDSSLGGGWNNAVIELILDADISSDHTLEIKMAQEDQDKRFTIMALAYTK